MIESGTLINKQNIKNIFVLAGWVIKNIFVLAGWVIKNTGYPPFKSKTI